MLIEISTGEVLDKISILDIKLSKINDQIKISNIKNEYDYLNFLCQSILESEDIKKLYTELYRINLLLWNIEDKIRLKEKASEFDDEFIELARSIYKTNDERAKIKKELNLVTQSRFIEEKSYEQY